MASSDQREEKVVPGTGDNGGMHTITGLTPYTNYYIEVAAVNSDGDTGPFAAITVETLQDSKRAMEGLHIICDKRIQ